MSASIRSKKGSMAELGPVLFVLLFMFVIPMINLGSLATRYALAMTVCREAAHQSAVSYTFEKGSPGKPSAIEAVDAAVSSTVARFAGIKIVSKDIDIIATDVNTEAIDRFTDKLTAPANTQSNIYTLETILVADLSPLITYTGPFLSNIPGLTGPYRVRLCAREFAENPQGLNQ